MTKVEFSWQTSDNLKIYGREWPLDTPKAAIALVHGLGEHIERYDHLANYYNEQGIAIVGYDRRGHGKSEGKRGHTISFEAFLDEISQLLTITKEKYPQSPIFLYGHSMGGNLVLNYVLKRRPDIKGFLVTGSHIKLVVPPSAFVVKAANVLKKVLPSLSQGNGLDPTHVSSNKAIVDDYINDPLVHDQITLNTASGMIAAADYLDNFAGSIDVPGLLMHGESDKICSPEGSTELSKRIKGDITLKLWPELYHEVHNEAIREKVYDFSIKWLKKHI